MSEYERDKLRLAIDELQRMKMKHKQNLELVEQLDCVLDDVESALVYTDILIYRNNPSYRKINLLY
ncbi:MAG: hypothetical protein DRI65_19215 [Chloroflexota bacterium]|nr:MAG: hypothetical protein DRI65_19215 [Chloroflexota bacterium]